MTVASVRAIRGKCRKVAKAHGMLEEAEDFSSWVLIKILEGRTSNVYQFFVDFLRELYGHKIINGKQSKINLLRRAVINTISVDGLKPHVLDKLYLMAEIPKPDQDKYEDMIVRLADSVKLTEEERTYFLLHHREGLLLKEIGVCFGEPEVYVSSVIKEATYKITRYSACIDEFIKK